MRSAKTKNHANKPYGYLQSVLMDTARPFVAPVLTRDLLGQSNASNVQQLNSSRVIPGSFSYQDTAYSLNSEVEKAGSNQSAGIQRSHSLSADSVHTGVGDSQLNEKISQPVSGAKETLAQDARPQHQQKSETLLSWLEKAQQQVNLPMEMFDDNIAQTKNAAANISVDNENKLHGATHNESADYSVSQSILANKTLQSFRQNDAAQPHKMQSLKNNNGVKPDSSKAARRNFDKTVMTLPTMDKQKSGNKSVNANRVSGSHNESDISNKPAVLADVSADKKLSVTHIKQAAQVKPAMPDNSSVLPMQRSRRFETVPQLETDVSRVHSRVENQKPINKPVYKSGNASQAMKVDKLQQVMQVQQNNMARVQQTNSSQTQTRPDAVSEPAQTINNKLPPQVHQQVVVVNSTAPGSAAQPAFLERSYLGRSGPRSYK